MNYWDAVHPTYIENWPAALHSLSIASVDVPLTVEDARRLGSNIMELGEGFCYTPEEKANNESVMMAAHKRMLQFRPGQPLPPQDYPDPVKASQGPWDISDISARVSEAVAKFPAGAFVRLGSRSPKDSWDGAKNGFKISVGEGPLRFVLDCSERISDDLHLAIAHEYPPHIWVRQWTNIPRWAEFRCFMKKRRLVGISQYNYLDGEVFPEITRDPSLFPWVIGEFFTNFHSASHLEDVVFDVFVKSWTRRDNTSHWEVKLLEINPFFEMTDPCLFSWSKDFDGEFRYNTPTGVKIG